MNVVLVIPTLQQGGAERVISEIGNSWVNKPNIDIHLVLLVNKEKFYALSPKIHIHQLGQDLKSSNTKLSNEIRVYFELRKVLKSLKPIFVLSFLTKYNIFVILASFFVGTKVIVSDRSNPNKKSAKFLTILKKITYRYARGIIAQTSLAKKILSETIDNSNICVIPNPVKHIQPNKTFIKEKIILTIGRMVPEKGQNLLLEAFALLSDQDSKLVILGNGPMREELERKIKDLKLSNRVLLPGTVRNVDEWLFKSSIFAFTSISEGFPNALLEAMATGLPCVSFDCDAGPRDIIDNGVNGFIVEVGNVNSFAKHMDLLLNNEILRNKIGKNASIKSNDFNIGKISNMYWDFCTS